MKLKYIIDKEYDFKYLDSAPLYIRDHFDDIYNNGLKYLEQARKSYQKSWDDIGRDFSDYIEKETGYHWFYPIYYCVVSITVQGVSNWGHESKIMRGWQENPYSQRRITAHELILSHYFEIYRRHYSQNNLSDGQIWALAEIAAFALTSLTNEANKYWPWDFSGYYTDHNYPQIVELQQKMEQKFLKKNDFDQYIRAGIELVKKYPNIKP